MWYLTSGLAQARPRQLLLHCSTSCIPAVVWRSILDSCLVRSWSKTPHILSFVRMQESMVSDKGQRVANESVPLALITNFLLLTAGSCTSFDAEAGLGINLSGPWATGKSRQSVQGRIHSESWEANTRPSAPTYLRKQTTSQTSSETNPGIDSKEKQHLTQAFSLLHSHSAFYWYTSSETGRLLLPVLAQNRKIVLSNLRGMGSSST